MSTPISLGLSLSHDYDLIFNMRVMTVVNCKLEVVACVCGLRNLSGKIFNRCDVIPMTKRDHVRGH